jgi:hypothetical protein
VKWGVDGVEAYWPYRPIRARAGTSCKRSDKPSKRGCTKCSTTKTLTNNSAQKDEGIHQIKREANEGEGQGAGEYPYTTV